MNGLRHLSLILLLFTASAAAEPPHIVLVMADDQGWGDMAYTGHPIVKTPNFDASAAAGLRFDRFYAAAPVCSPTRASVMTGRTPNRMAVFSWGHSIRPQEVTIAEALKTAGYTTGHFGKWHLGAVRNGSPASPGANGFDRWVSAPNFYDNDAVMSDEGKAVPRKGESSFIAVDDAITWMSEAVKGDAPILAVVWFGSPHSPHIAAEEDLAHYADQPKKMANFLGEITGMDRAFGKLRGALDELGIRDNTILWYCSDNGALRDVGNAGEYRGKKGDVYEGGLRVPAFLEWPAKIPQPRSTRLRATTSDIYPTLLSIAGVEMEDQPPLDGVSLLPLIEGEMKSRPGIGFWEHPTNGIGTSAVKRMEELLEAQKSGGDLPAHESSLNAAKLPDPPHPVEGDFPGHAAWIDGDWKLHRIQNKGGAVKWEFYDLAADPSESRNLLADESQRVQEYRGHLERWLGNVARSLNGEDY
ncbi:MAG: sulfatase-like hydrolase/transferase [Verrucomicrobiota bacterium]